MELLQDDLKNALDLVQIRNKYAHNGIAKDKNGNFIFIKLKDRGLNGENNMITELDEFVKSIQRLITSIHTTISK